MTESPIVASDLACAFTDAARAYPDRIAVSGRDGYLTYRELDDRSTGAARVLVSLGVEHGVVALYTGRTAAMAVGIVAILKAGAAYLPIESSHPAERTLGLIRSAGPTAVVTTAENAADAAARVDLGGVAQVVLDEFIGAKPSAGAAMATRQPGSLAYVLATSGSTGEPKGVQIEDRNVLALVRALYETILQPLGPQLRIAMVAPQIFDASVQQIFPTLLLGHTLVVVPEQVRADGQLLRRFWSDERIDISDGTPAHLMMTARATGAPRIGVRHLLIGGEALSTAVVRQFLAECDHSEVRVTNVYGVAECCVDSTAGWADPSEPYETVPIGHPLPGTVIELLDAQGVPVAEGELGELYIGGDGVGRGYLVRDDLNRQRFRPVAGHEGRFYRTGDLARRLPDGRLVFAGRADRQFKLRGHRIEPAEIEAALRRYAGPVEVAVAAGTPEPSVCRMCLLTSAYPDVTVVDGVCSVCTAYDGYRAEVERYFGQPEQLLRLIRARARPDANHDVLLLFSGGKDSTYVLYRLIDAGLRVLAFTFDNGYISKAAFDNIRRITASTGVDLEVGSVPAMDSVFSESLRAESSVCGGCFRGLTAMSTRMAAERGIPVVVTGLSRGQIFDAKLRRLFDAGVRDPEEIDRRLAVHRTLYHARQDRTSVLLGLPVAPDAMEETLFLDYFRYDPVPTDEVRRFLISRDRLWEQPKDTGLCSTNCRINEVGIYVHSLERGFHNYAAPLSWDCRLGVLSREQGLREIASVAPLSQVSGMLRRLGYTPRPRRSTITDAVAVLGSPGAALRRIIAYYVADRDVDESELMAHLTAQLPDYMVPSHLVRLDCLPVTETGKVDVHALPDPRGPVRTDGFHAPEGATEARIADIWKEALGISSIGRDQDFFEAGGDSLTATIVAGLMQAEFGTALPVAELFRHPTIAHGAALVRHGERQELVPLNGAATGTPVSDELFLMPDVWGGVDGYRELAVRIDRPVWGLPPTDHGTDPDIDADSRVHAQRIVGRSGSHPVAIGGWSFGGLLAFATAHHVRALGGRVAHLTIVDTMPPDRDYWSRQLDLCHQFLDGRGEASPPPYEVQRVVPPGARSDPETLRGYARRVLPALRALAAYEPPEEAAAHHVVVVRATGSGVTDEHSAQWMERAPGRSTAVTVAGDHFSVLAQTLAHGGIWPGVLGPGS